jgi:hypothetical protein
MAMKWMPTLLCLAFLACVSPCHAALTERQKKLAEIEKLDFQLKPLRIRATREADVIAAREKADEALRRYYEALRAAMIRLEPKQKKNIDRQARLRHEVNGGSGGSRAEDYRAAAEREKKAAAPAIP